jgi:phosphopantothenoylcysteine decarboxylase/phosphopantothenate--cysteine ligase
VAAYKSLELIRLLKKEGQQVRCVLTAAGSAFVTPLSVGALSGAPVHTDLFSLTEEAAMGHIELSRAAELVVVAPATGDLMAKAAAGLADDLASTLLLATDAPVLMAPAMNVRMWEHKATRRNLETLRRDGILFVGPGEGEMACGEYGEGRMAEPAEILAAIRAALSGLAGAALHGRRALVTAGPTLEPLDPVRFFSNRSSGRQGYAMAAALAALGAEVVLVSGPTCLDAPRGVRRIAVETAADMLAACLDGPAPDLAVLVAAVADVRPKTVSSRKLKKASGALDTVVFEPNPDILETLSRPGPNRPRLVVGFAAETEDLEANALEKLKRKGCDWIVANDVGAGGVMGGLENAVTIYRRDGTERIPWASKEAVAERLAASMAAALGAKL